MLEAISARRRISSGPQLIRSWRMPSALFSPSAGGVSNLDGTTLMSKGREIRCYDYVNHPYEQVRDALRQDAITVFQSATKAAASRAQSIASELHVDVGGIGVKSDIRISVKNVEEKVFGMSTPATRLLLEWEAATMPRLFPFMKAELSIYPLTATETQLDLWGL